MIGDKWKIPWNDFLSNSYAYGSKIEFNSDGSVTYANRLMPPGTVINTWYSQTNFQKKRVEPSLPLIDGEAMYSISSDIEYNSPYSKELMLRIVFYDRYDAPVQTIIVREPYEVFKPSIKTYSYQIDLINGGHANFTFKSMTIKEISEEEYAIKQAADQKLKADSDKDKKKRRKNKKSK